MSKVLSKPRIYETLLFFALLSGPPRFRDRDPFASLSGAVDWSILLNIAVWGLAAFWVFLNFGGYILKRRAVPRFDLLHILAFLLVFCLYLSTFASIAPSLTFYRVSQVLIAVLFGFFWVRRFGVDSTLGHLLAGYLVVALMIGVAAVVAPDLVYSPIREGLRGDAIANTGAVAAMGLILALCYPVTKSPILNLIMIAFLSAFLILSMTRVAYVAVQLFIFVAFLILPRSKPLRLSLYLLSVLITVGLMFPLVPSLLTSWITRGGEGLSTLSDRTPLWQYVVSETLERSPLIGVGFYANRTITTAYNPALGTSHSAYLEVFSGGGILSFSIFSVMLIAGLFLVARLLLSHGRNPRIFAVVCLFLVIVVVGVTSEDMVIASPTSFTFWILLSIIPVVTRTVHTQTRRGEIETSQNNLFSSRVLPATRW